MKTATLRVVRETVITYRLDPENYEEDGISSEDFEAMAQADADGLMSNELAYSDLEVDSFEQVEEVISAEVLDVDE